MERPMDRQTDKRHCITTREILIIVLCWLAIYSALFIHTVLTNQPVNIVQPTARRVLQKRGSAWGKNGLILRDDNWEPVSPLYVGGTNALNLLFLLVYWGFLHNPTATTSLHLSCN